MQELIKKLVETAQIERAVATQRLSNGMQLVIYPMDAGVLVALGYTGAQAHRAPPHELLRKRSQNMHRFGTWLPAMFNDGGIYVTRRVMRTSDNALALVADEGLMYAQELLS